MNRLRLLPALVSVLLLTACIPKFSNDTEVTQDTEEVEQAETTIIPSRQLSENYYRTLIPYKESSTRGLVVSNLNTKYDMKEVENGLMRLSQRAFDTSNYYFQEGQYLSASTVKNWLARPNQTSKEAPHEQGLNPSSLVEGTSTEMEPTVKAEKAPVYLSHIVEQNYLTKTEDNKVKLGGVSIGLALNSIYYYQKEQYGEFYEEPIEQAQLEKAGKDIAAEVITRLRARPDLADVPIVIGLFRQEAKNSIVPGTYFAYSVSSAGGGIGEWEAVSERYVTFPMSSPDEVYREMNKSFQNFKQDVDTYFSNFTSVFGTGFYQNNSIQSLEIEIPIQFYGTAELIGFTQYLTGVMLNTLPANLAITVSITSVNGPEALIKKEASSGEPFVHIYE